MMIPTDFMIDIVILVIVVSITFGLMCLAVGLLLAAFYRWVIKSQEDDDDAF